MPNAYTHFVTWISRGRRHHGSAMEDIGPQPPPSVMAQGDSFQPAWAPPSISWNDNNGQHTANFAFWSVTGGTNGPYVSTSNTPPAATVGSNDIVATAWYIPGGGGGNGGPGVLIDAFDVALGNFVDDDFVTISPDNSLTAAANEEGFVPTEALEHVLAFNSIHAVPFGEWQVVAGSESASATDLTAAAHSSAVAFAFYQTSSIGRPPFNPGDRAAGTWVSWGVMVDGGGPTGRGPVPPWNPFIRQLAAGFALADAAREVNPEFQSKVLSIAARQVDYAADAIKREMQQFSKEGLSRKGEVESE